MPLLTVVIPVLNMAEWLPPAIESCLWQKGMDVEVLVVDGGSRDGTPAIVDAYAAQDSRVRLVSRPGYGLGASRQVGQDEAAGDFVTWMDADDFLDKHAAAAWVNAAQRNRSDMVCANVVAFLDRSFNARRHFYHPAADKLHFDSAPGYWKSKVVWRWIFSLPFLREQGLTHTEFKVGQDVCFMYRALLRAERFCQIEPVVYYFRQEHKHAQHSVAVQVEHGFGHFGEVKRVLLRDTPDGVPRIKPFVKYLNENYWRDVKKVAPRLVGSDAAWEETLVGLGLDLFDGLDPAWFRAGFLASELREVPAFLPFADAMIARDTGAVKAVIRSLQVAARPAPDRRNLYHTVRHRMKSLFNPLSHAARSRLSRLEELAAKRPGIPKPESL